MKWNQLAAGSGDGAVLLAVNAAGRLETAASPNHDSAKHRQPQTRWLVSEIRRDATQAEGGRDQRNHYYHVLERFFFVRLPPVVRHAASRGSLPNKEN